MGGKTALDYLIRVRGYGFVEAVETLCGVRAGQSFSFQTVKKRELIPFALPPPNGNKDRVIAYLRSRGIDSEIINACVRRGDLYESAKTHNCVFVGRDKSGVPRFACMRGTLSGFKQDVTGSQKHYGFVIPGTPDSRGVCVFESPADALSAATLHKMSAEPWEQHHYLSLGGVSPLALLRFLQDRPEVDQIVLSLDNDEAGRGGTWKIIDAIQGDASLNKRITDITDAPPGHGKDFNEYLQHVLQEQKSVSDRGRQKKAAVSL